MHLNFFAGVLSYYGSQREYFAMKLEKLGWNRNLEASLLLAQEDVSNSKIYAGRVTADHGGRIIIETEEGPRHSLRRGLRSDARDSERPVVGDWVLCEDIPGDQQATRVAGILDRRSLISRPDPAGDAQLLAANVDCLLIVSALNADFNLSRLERYLILARKSGIDAAIVLTKSDLCAETEERVAEVHTVSPETPVIVTSCVTGQGLDNLEAFLAAGKTFLLAGSSGTGKSTLLNHLVGYERMKTSATSEFKDRGHHTTTHRELILLPSGAILVDIPGMRQLGVDADAEDVDALFDDIQELAKHCRYSNCRHGAEPDCAVRAAIEAGELSERRLRNFLRVSSEARVLQKARRNEKELVSRKRAREFSKMAREVANMKRRNAV